MTSPSETHFGLTGLATMGANLARNVAHHGIPVAVHNRTASRMHKFLEEHGSEGPISGYESVADWVHALARPRVLMSMVKAGQATDAVIDEIAPHVDPGDIIIDGGNAHYRDTQRRHAKLAEQGIHFLGVGVSGGEEGRSNGPSIMPGGDREPYDESVKPIFETIAAQVDGTPCCTYVSPDGAGHYVKMVHNGIEYADMQLIAESYDLLRNGARLGGPRDRRPLQGLERVRAGVVPDRDLRSRPRQDRRCDRQAAGRRDSRRRRAEGHRPLDGPGRARAGGSADRDHRSRVRQVAERTEGPARSRRRCSGRTGRNAQRR